ncbi:glycosyltransferase family 4 protein [uncultured Draconibacterium sp.]|uniref:glycosyltransferase family 4 protein n=1 Tax=uncultured Draconibacterium sp. TaxID=1573823 RepID=UPI0029C8FF5F|nr:glycosyltransferase family 4 protein [uncultured Draconibacterium sp.]
MKKINWIILKSKDRGIDYGVGTFIKQLSSGLASQDNIDVFILEAGITKNKSFFLRQENGITILEVPTPDGIIDTKRNQEKLSRNISRIVTQYIPKNRWNIIHMNYIFQYFIAMSLKKTLNGRIIFTQHVFVTSLKLQKNFFNTEFETYKRADQIITVTQHGKKHLTKKGVDAKKIKCIYNGIDPEKFSKFSNVNIKSKYGLPKHEKLILYSGRIDNIKGLNYLCQAIQSLVNDIPDIRLVIAGDGDYNSLIKSTRNFSAHISFLGFIPFEDLVVLYQEADIGVIPSLEEHCSYVALEMLHSGLPVVASNLGGLKEIFINEENALLVETIMNKTNGYGVAPKVENLRNKINILLTTKTLQIKLSRNAKTRANSIFTTNNMVKEYILAINNLLINDK